MSSYIYYLRDEVAYGASLYISGWKKFLIHPLQTIKDTAYALYHPVQTGKILVTELKQHPIGMVVNIGLAWVTGRAVSSTLHYLQQVNLSSTASHFPNFLQNSMAIPESVFSSVSQAIQLGTQMMSGGCCGGICTTTAARLSQTASLITSQSASISRQPSIQPQQDGGLKTTVHAGFVPYFDCLKNSKKEPECDNRDCLSKKTVSKCIR